VTRELAVPSIYSRLHKHRTEHTLSPISRKFLSFGVDAVVIERVELSGGSPHRRHRKDLESGDGSSGAYEECDSVNDPFDIVRTKSAPVDRLRRW
ncbi:hypothetical protein M8C21_033138, partial [Ambrosia artemisiifolia]